MTLKLRYAVLGCMALVFSTTVLLTACKTDPKDFEPDMLELPADPKNYDPVERFAVMNVPADNPMTAEKATLGWQLFFDARLSGDGTRSCYSCHLNEKGLSDGIPTAIGAFDKHLTKNSPTLWNIGYHQNWYWNGRAPTLEKQAAAAWTGGNMGAKKVVDKVLEEINSLPGYQKQFAKVFGGPATATNIPQALACYMRTIVSDDTAWDRYTAGDENAVSDAAKRGFEVFKRSKCDNCHSGVFFTDLQFHNVGIGSKNDPPDPGRFTVTKVEKDKGAFKTPTLRDVVDSGPYFHDGSTSSLKMALKIMINGGIENPYLDKTNMQPQKVNDEEFDDLMEFLKSLDVKTKLKKPRLPN